MPRELIEPHAGDKRYVRRKRGKFTKSQDDVGRSLSADRRRKAKRVAKKGEGDRGDRKPRNAKLARRNGKSRCSAACSAVKEYFPLAAVIRLAALRLGCV